MPSPIWILPIIYFISIIINFLLLIFTKSDSNWIYAIITGYQVLNILGIIIQDYIYKDYYDAFLIPMIVIMAFISFIKLLPLFFAWKTLSNTSKNVIGVEYLSITIFMIIGLVSFAKLQDKEDV